MLKIAAGEIHMLTVQTIGLDCGARASKHGDISPVAAIEVQVVPLAVVELAGAELALLELRLGEGAVGEGAASDGDALEVAGGEGATRELAPSPAGLSECGGSEAAAGENGGGELGEVQVQAHVSVAVGHADKACGRATGPFAPEIVGLDDQLGGHGLWLCGDGASFRLLRNRKIFQFSIKIEMNIEILHLANLPAHGLSHGYSKNCANEVARISSAICSSKSISHQ